MRSKLKLNLEELTVTSFDTTRAEKPRGTVFGEQCTCYTNCTCPGCPTCDHTCAYTCDDATCPACPTCAQSCNGTCDCGTYDCGTYDCGTANDYTCRNYGSCGYRVCATVP